MGNRWINEGNDQTQRDRYERNYDRYQIIQRRTYRHRMRVTSPRKMDNSKNKK